MRFKDLSKKEKIKKIAKYVVNSLNMLNFILLGLGEIFHWNLDTASKVIILLAGAISYYLVGGKLFEIEEFVPEKDKENE